MAIGAGYEDPFDGDGNSNNDQVKVNEFRVNKDNKSLIRLLPGRTEKEGICYKYVQHWMVVKGSDKKFPITHRADEKCKLCNIRDQIFESVNAWKDEKNPANDDKLKLWLDRARKIKPKECYDYNIINRKHRTEDGKKELKIFRFTPPASAQDSIIRLTKKAKDDGTLRYGKKPYDAVEGYDIALEAVKDEKKLVDGKPIYTYEAEFEQYSPLTSEELEMLRKEGYDLKALRKTTPAEKIDEIILKSSENWLRDFEIIEYESEKVDIKELKKEEPKSEPVPEPQKPKEEEVGSGEEDSDNEEETENVSMDAEVADINEDINEDENVAGEDNKVNDVENTLLEMDCRGTYNKGDEECQKCILANACLELKEIADKAEEMSIEILDEGDFVKSKEVLLAEIKKKERIDKPKGRKIEF